MRMDKAVLRIGAKVLGSISREIFSLSWGNHTVGEVVAAEKISQEYLTDLSIRSLVFTIMLSFKVTRPVIR